MTVFIPSGSYSINSSEWDTSKASFGFLSLTFLPSFKFSSIESLKRKTSWVTKENIERSELKVISSILLPSINMDFLGTG